MKDKLDKELFIQKLSTRCDYTIRDTKIFLNKMIELFEDCVADGVTIDIRGFCHMYYQTIPKRRGYKPIRGKPGEGEYMDYPEARRLIFSLGKNLRRLVKDNPYYCEDGEEGEDGIEEV